VGIQLSEEARKGGEANGRQSAQTNWRPTGFTGRGGLADSLAGEVRHGARVAFVRSNLVGRRSIAPGDGRTSGAFFKSPPPNNRLCFRRRGHLLRLAPDRKVFPFLLVLFQRVPTHLRQTVLGARRSGGTSGRVFSLTSTPHAGNVFFGLSLQWAGASSNSAPVHQLLRSCKLVTSRALDFPGTRRDSWPNRLPVFICEIVSRYFTTSRFACQYSIYPSRTARSLRFRWRTPLTKSPASWPGGCSISNGPIGRHYYRLGKIDQIFFPHPLPVIYGRRLFSSADRFRFSYDDYGKGQMSAVTNLHEARDIRPSMFFSEINALRMRPSRRRAVSCSRQGDLRLRTSPRLSMLTGTRRLD